MKRPKESSDVSAQLASLNIGDVCVCDLLSRDGRVIPNVPLAVYRIADNGTIIAFTSLNLSLFHLQKNHEGEIVLSSDTVTRIDSVTPAKKAVPMHTDGFELGDIIDADGKGRRAVVRAAVNNILYATTVGDELDVTGASNYFTLIERPSDIAKTN